MNRGLRVTTAAVGVVFGFLITTSGFGNYATIHQALLFRSWYLFAVFGSGLTVATAGLVLVRRTGTTVFGGPLRLPYRPAQPRHFYGTAIFGAGFGLCGTCPGGVIAMVAIGGLGGLLVLAGLAGGLWLRGVTEGASRSRLTRPLPASVPADPGSRAATAGQARRAAGGGLAHWW